MNRRISVFLVLVIALIVAIAFIAPNTRNRDKGESEPSSGLEDSIFDDDSEESEDQKQQSTEQQEEQKGQQSTEKEPTGQQQGQQPTDKQPESESQEKPNTGGNVQENVEIKEMDYESFHEMAPSKQQEYMESFASLDAFFEWYNAEKEKYEKEHPSIEIGGGAIDLDKIAGEE